MWKYKKRAWLVNAMPIVIEELWTQQNPHEHCLISAGYLVHGRAILRNAVSLLTT